MKRVTYMHGKFFVSDVHDQSCTQEGYTMHFQDHIADEDAVWKLYSSISKHLEVKIRELEEEQQGFDRAYEAFLRTQREGEREMNIKGRRIKCISNLQAPDLIAGKVYTADNMRTNTHGVWQVEVGGKWYAQHRFELAKENEMVKQQFYIGDSVRICDTPQDDTRSVVYWDSEMDVCCGEVGIIEGFREHRKGVVGYRVRFTSGVTWYFIPEWFTIVERAWQKHTGKQPVEDGVEVEVKLRCAAEYKCLAGELHWNFEDSSGDIVEWRLADSESSVEYQPERSIPLSHIALGEELVTGGEQPDKKHSHYFKKCGYEYVDVYRVLKMFDVTDPCISHACKKLLVSGGRGFKDINHDIQDVIDTLVRWQEMQKEDENA